MGAFSGCPSSGLKSSSSHSIARSPELFYTGDLPLVREVDSSEPERNSMDDIHQTKPVDQAASESVQQSYSTIVEIRQYTLYPGQRDVLIELFERAFIEAQEAV